MEIRTVAVQFPEKEYIKRIFVAVSLLVEREAKVMVNELNLLLFPCQISSVSNVIRS